MTPEQGLYYSFSMAIGALGTAKTCIEQMKAHGIRIPYEAIALNILELEEAMDALENAAEEDSPPSDNDYYAQNN